MNLTEADVMKRVGEIRENQEDPERAYGMEIKLFRDVLEKIAQGRGGPVSILADAALQTLKIPFRRETS